MCVRFCDFRAKFAESSIKRRIFGAESKYIFSQNLAKIRILFHKIISRKKGALETLETFETLENFETFENLKKLKNFETLENFTKSKNPNKTRHIFSSQNAPF
ncbi:hypothetical protein ACWIUD_05600 [Helicobacter sp. 23-1044]